MIMDRGYNDACGYDGGCRYDIIRRLGRGGTAEVYLAHDNVRKERVALKCGAGGSSLAKEYYLMKKLDFPGIPKAYDYFRDKNVISMEYIEGETLGELMKGKASFGQLAEIVIKICMIASYLHENAGVLYLDFKPSNIMAGRGMAWLIDYGACEYIGSVSDLSGKTLYGTRQYAAYEQFDAEGGLDVRTDIFQIGSILQSIVQCRNIRSKNISRIIKRCTERDMSERYSGAAELGALIAGNIRYKGVLFRKEVQ